MRLGKPVIEGYIDNGKLSNGDDSTFPSSVKLLTHMDGGEQSNSFKDDSIANRVITNAESHDTYVKACLHGDGVDQGVAPTEDATAKAVTNTETYDSYTKLMMHMNGTDQAVAPTDSIGKAVTNTEAYDSYTKLMLHLDNNVTDAATAKTVTNVGGNVTFSSTVYRYASHSAYFNGSNAYLTVPDSADWHMGSDNFTVDCWVNFASVASSQMIFFQGSSSVGFYIQWIQSNKYLRFIDDTAGISIAGAANSFIPVVNTWYHIAFIRGWGGNANDFAITVNGVAVTTGTSSAALTNYANELWIGNCNTSYAVSYFNGYMDELRVSNGIARWKSNFIPYRSEYGQVATVTGNKKFGTACAEFKGSGEVLSFADSADFDMGTGDWTVEAWVNVSATTRLTHGIWASGTNYPHTDGYVSTYYDGSHYVGLSSKNPSGTWDMDLSTSGAVNFVAGTWYHIAWSYIASSKLYKIHVDGVEKMSAVAAPVADSTWSDGVGFFIGRAYNNATPYYMNGCIDELRVNKGVARWTSAFTPYHSAYGQVSTITHQDSQLLLHLDNDVIDWASGKTVTNNNVTFSSTVSKFGGYAGYFNGTNARLTLADSDDWNLGSADFTIDGWIYLTSIASNINLMSQWGAAGNKGWVFRPYDTAGQMRFVYTSDGTNASTPGVNWSPSLSTWYHVAIVRSGSNLYFFVDGTQQGSAQSMTDTIFNSTALAEVGATSNDGTGLLPGTYVDELRFSKGVARWTTTFTAPVSAYTNNCKMGNGALEFKGSGEYLSLADSDDFSFGTGDFTIEGWVKFEKIVAGINYMVCSQYADNSNCWYLQYKATEGVFDLFFTIGGVEKAYYYGSSSFGLSAGVWYHLAVVRSGATCYMLIDGVSKSLSSTTAFGTNDVGNVASALTIGAWKPAAPALFMDGQVDEFRISKGIARWTAAFTPWKTPYGKVGKTTAVKQIGTASAEFKDGSKLSLADSDDFFLDTNDFTFDFWLRVTSLTSNAGIYEQYADSNNWIGFYWNRASVVFGFYAISATVTKAQYRMAFNPTVDTWYHMAVVRSGVNFYIFVNGVSQSLTADVAIGSNSMPNIAANAVIGYDSYYGCLNGYIDEFRVSKGVARWTSNFAVPLYDYGDSDTDIWDRLQTRLKYSTNAGSLFSKPVCSTYSLVYTTTNAYLGGVLTPNGDIHFIPINATVGQKVNSSGTASTYSLVYTTSNAYAGGVLAANGDVHFIPYTAARGQKLNSSGVVSTYALVYTTSQGAYIGGILASNGEVHFSPFYAPVGQKISSAGVVSTYALAYTAAAAHTGCVLSPNGDIHFIPYAAVVGQKISSAGVVSTYSLAYTNAAHSIGGALAANGDIHFIPYSAAVGQKVSSAGVVSTYSLVYTTANAYMSGVLAPNGDLHFVPSMAIVGQKVSVDGVVSTYSLAYTVAEAYGGGTLTPNGDIHFIPYAAARGQKISTFPARPWNMGLCTSGFFNKF